MKNLKIDKSVKTETLYIAASVVIMSMLMQAIFLISGFWSLSVLWGNLLSASAAILNFFIMGLTVQKAVNKDEKDAATTMKASQSLRFFFILVVAILGVVLDCFNTIAALVPLFFPRIAVALRPLFSKKNANK